MKFKIMICLKELDAQLAVMLLPGIILIEIMTLNYFGSRVKDIGD
jgi:hypothetical protein